MTQPEPENLADLGNPEDAFLVAIVRGQTVRDAARQAGMPERSAYRLATTPDFKARVHAERRRITERVFADLALLGTEAVRTLRDLLANGTPTIKMAAVREVLGGLLKGWEGLRADAEIDDMKAQLSAILAKPSSSSGPLTPPIS